MKLYIYNLESSLYEGETPVLTLPAEDGEISILDHHIPLVTSLKKGSIRFSEKENKKEIPVEKGFAYTDGESVIVLAN